MPHPAYLFDITGLQPSSVILGTLAGLALAVAALYLSGLIGTVVGLLGHGLHASIRQGFGLWALVLSWAPYPVFLALVLGLLGLGLHLADTQPALAALTASGPLAMGV